VIVNKKVKVISLALIVVLATAAFFGCGKQQGAKPGQAVPVKAMNVMQKDTPLVYEYAGQVKAKNEVKVQARVSGNIVEKYVSGGEMVRKGQPLFRIDSRQYESVVLSAKAQLAQAEANLSNSRLDTQRYLALAAQEAIDKQKLDTQQSVESQHAAVVEYNRANVQKATDDLNDTLIVAPVDGRLDVNELSVGNYVQSGTTTLATISSTDPVFIQFSMSENEYLSLAKNHQNGFTEKWGNNVTITLSDGTEYPLKGAVEQVDSTLANNSGTLTLKALFGNPNKILIPGMFARIKMTGEMKQGALLIPQRAVQQVLEKTFVVIVGAENKAEMKEVKIGSRVGSFFIVESGITANDVIVVEGLNKVQNGAPLAVEMVTAEQLQLSTNI